VISRRTIFSLLLALLILFGLRAALLGHRDDCDAIMPITHQKPVSVYVESGTRTVEMPCTMWLPRQPVWVQMVCLVDFAVMIVFLLSVWRDCSRWLERRRGRG
jgi:hypothetical protein